MFRTALRGLAAATLLSAALIGAPAVASAAPSGDQPAVCSPLPTRCTGGDAPAGTIAWLQAMTNLLAR